MGGLVLPSLIYFLVTVAAAMSTPLVGGPRVPALIWLCGAVVLIVVLLRRRKNRVSDPESGWPVLRGALVILVAAFLAFIAMVNIWERLGIPH